MKKLTKEQATLLASLLEEAQEAYEKLEGAVCGYNDILTRLNELRDDVHNQMQEFFDERSEKWQEGEAGEAYQTWMDLWGNDLETVDLPEDQHESVEEWTEAPE